MKAVRDEAIDLELTLPGADESRTLPAKRINAFDPELGETEADAHQAVLTRWRPDDGERKALANGACVELVIHVPGEAHPPVSLSVGNPDPELLTALLTKDHVDRAVGFFFAALAEQLATKGDLGTPEECLELWHKALEETREGAAPVDLGERLDEVRAAVEEGEPNGNGKG